MGNVNLIGKEMMNFPDKETKQLIKGIRLHLTVPDDRVSGLSAVRQFIRIDNPAYDEACSLPLGPVAFEYGFRGRVVGVHALPAGK